MIEHKATKKRGKKSSRKRGQIPMRLIASSARGAAVEGKKGPKMEGN